MTESESEPQIQRIHMHTDLMPCCRNEPQYKHQRKVEFAIGIFLMILALYLGYDSYRLNQTRAEQAEKLARENTILVTQVNCNSQLMAVLRKRSDARILVDLTTMQAEEAMMEYLNDQNEDAGKFTPNDPHTLNARDAMKKAAEARANPDLWLPYPDCNAGSK